MKDNFYNIEPITPTKTLSELNKQLLLKSINLGGNLSDTHSLPASMGTIIQVDFESNKLSLAHVGDTYAILYAQDGSSRVITDDKNKKFDNEMFALMKRIAREKEISNREARQDDRVHKDLFEMFIKRNNNPDGTGSGIINGDPNMEKYIYENTFSLTSMESILVASDGFEIQGSSVENETFRKEIIDVITNNGMKELIRKKKQSEDDDPDWNNIRYKHSDDATAVLCTFKE